MTNLKNHVKKKGEAELSVIFFFKGSLPDTINLKDCAFPFRTPIENCFPALYGNISKRNGILAANEYADKHQLNFTVIDFRISLEDAVDTTPKNKKEFFHSEVISLNRLSRNKIFQLYDDYIDDNSKKILKNKTAYLDLIEKPELLTHLINHQDFEKLKLLIYMAKTAISETPLTIGYIPYKNWDVITSAACRLHPNIKVNI